MNPRWLLSLAYAILSAAWLYLGLLALGNDEPLHLAVSMIQAGFAACAVVAALLLPRVAGLLLHWIGLAGIALASTALTVDSFDAGTWFLAGHAAQSIGLLVALWAAVQWWLASSGARVARRLAFGYALAALGALTVLVLNFAGHGHPFQDAQRPYAAAADGLLALGLVLAGWMGGVAALTMGTPEPKETA